MPSSWRLTRKKLPRCVPLHPALVAALAIAGCGLTPPPTLTLHGQTMGTYYQLTVVAADLSPEAEGQIARRLQETLAAVNAGMSTYDPDSELSRFNASRSTDPVPVSAATAQVVEQALAVHRLSDGRFDVTVGPLVDLWGFGPPGRQPNDPDPQSIRQTLNRVGSDKLRVSVDPPTLQKLDPELAVDLSAIAKGYGVDAVSRELLAAGYAHHLIDIGGEVVARGHGPQGRAWRVGIERPALTAQGPREIAYIVELTDRALATSGNYRNYIEREGRRLSHVIDPTTGRPIHHPLLGVTVIAGDCAWADALATAALALGPEKGMRLLEELPEVEGLGFVSSADGSPPQPLFTSGMGDLLVDDKPTDKQPVEKLHGVALRARRGQMQGARDDAMP